MKVNNQKTVFSDDTQNMLFQMEADSWWFQYRAKVIVGLMKKYFDETIKTIDIGGGNGYTTAVAKQKGFNMGLLEPSEGACQNAQKRGIDAHAGMLTDEYPKDGEYGQVLLLDVLEHIEDDMGFLGLLNRKISRGGWLLLTVPAYKILWSSEDDYANHYRRYTKKELWKSAENNNFDVIYASYFMQFLFLPILFGRVGFEKIRLLKRQDERTEEERAAVMDKQFKVKQDSFVKRALNVFERIEYNRITKGRHLSYGASVIMVLQRRQDV